MPFCSWVLVLRSFMCLCTVDHLFLSICIHKCTVSHPVNTDQNIDDDTVFLSNQILFNKWQCPSLWNHPQLTSSRLSSTELCTWKKSIHCSQLNSWPCFINLLPWFSCGHSLTKMREIISTMQPRLNYNKGTSCGNKFLIHGHDVLFIYLFACRVGLHIKTKA